MKLLDIKNRKIYIIKFTSLYSFVLLPFLVFSKPMQNGNLNPKRLESQVYALEVKDTVSSLDKLPFSAIRIIDSRFDTSKIGFNVTNNF